MAKVLAKACVPSLDQQALSVFSALSQHAVPGEMSQQKIHLVGEYAAALQVNIFGMCGHKRDRE